MNILITCNTITYMSGSCLYNYTLAMELAKQGHNVSIYSNISRYPIIDSGRDIMVKNLTDATVTLYDIALVQEIQGEFDVCFCSQQIIPKADIKQVINIVHSEYNCESPMDNADKYVAIRPSIKEHLIKEHGIPEDKISVIYNGVDRERFSVYKNKPHEGDYYKVVIPCTLDPLREKFLNYYIDQANEKFRVYIYGLDCGAKLHTNPYAYIHPPVWNIEDYMGGAECVAGILLGRVNLEANSMGLASYIHNPENPELKEYYYISSQSEFDKLHNITNVAKDLINLI